jgi:2Fe-2S ferredoxin
MIEVTFIQKDTGEKEIIKVPENTTLMEASRFYSKNKYVSGIEGDCGGNCSCATCHVHVPDNWLNITGPASDDTAELSLLEYEPNFDDKQSRLSCQILLTKKHHGLIVYVP